MILVDANLLIYAHVDAFPQHRHARDWLDRQLNDVPRVGLPWASLLAFLRLVTNPRVFEYPETTAAAWAQVTAWLGCSSAWVPQPTERHADVLAALLALPGIYGNLVPDADMAALAYRAWVDAVLGRQRFRTISESRMVEPACAVKRSRCGKGAVLRRETVAGHRAIC